MAAFNQNLTCTGLTTVTTAIQLAGVYGVDVKMTLPSLDDGDSANSACVLTITQNVTVVYTGVAGARGGHVTVNAAAGDTLSFAFTSGAAVDQGLNVVKATIAIG